ncbi:hypothetical protein QBC42DRAFT_52074 [Cladorrhinum samala]|uniref:Altered inheritance of mitochondria protein 11 n=1 Tax=Cladorrhinum samala TaxID=585594 RepID=A0AAV9HUT2_9PEZI|nr:hypothetical protein QBC42DRAFT_52074 [Cladorrhinum samala]
MIFSSIAGLLKPKPETNGSTESSQAQPASPTPGTASTPATPTPRQEEWEERPPYPPVFSRRSLKQLSLFFGGATFLCLSIAITRRRIRQHLKLSRLKLFDSNIVPPKEQRPQKDPLVAVEALNLATLNVMAAAIMVTGGISWALDCSTMGDLRRITHQRLLSKQDGVPDGEAEREVEEWVAKTLGLGSSAPENDDATGKKP